VQDKIVFVFDIVFIYRGIIHVLFRKRFVFAYHVTVVFAYHVMESNQILKSWSFGWERCNVIFWMGKV